MEYNLIYSSSPGKGILKGLDLLSVISMASLLQLVLINAIFSLKRKKKSVLVGGREIGKWSLRLV